jgi:exopolysaccharide biosynthesis protein
MLIGYFSALAFSGLALAASPPTVGSWERPFTVDRSFAFFGDTTDPAVGGDSVDRYSCSAERDESGREVVFELQLAEESDIDVMVETPSSEVDIDVHVLWGTSLTAAQATDCLDRDDKNATSFHRPVGRYLVVADTFVSTTKGERPGAFKLYVRVYPTTGVTRTTLGAGVVWNRSSVATGSGFTTANWVDMDPRAGARAQVVYSGSCSTLENAAKPANTVAAINAGFFTGGTCAPANFLRTGGITQKLSTGVEHVVGLGTDGQIGFGEPQENQDYTTFASAVGGRGFYRLQASGVTLDPDGTSGDFVNSRHPRSAILARPDGGLSIAAYDGRTGAGLGLKLAELGDALALLDRGLALNLDGGGSTQLWVKGEPLSSVVNYPSDNSADDHFGARGVGSFIAIVTEPAPEVPLFVSLPPPNIVLKDNEVLTYAVRFASGTPVVTASSGGGAVENATVVPGVGQSTFTFAPSNRQNGPVSFTLEACFGTSCASQIVDVKVELDNPYVPPPEPTGPTGPSIGEPSGPSVPPVQPEEPTAPVTPQNKPIISTPKSGCSAIGNSSETSFGAAFGWMAAMCVVVLARRKVLR